MSVGKLTVSSDFLRHLVHLPLPKLTLVSRNKSTAAILTAAIVSFTIIQQHYSPVAFSSSLSFQLSQVAKLHSPNQFRQHLKLPSNPSQPLPPFSTVCAASSPFPDRVDSYCGLPPSLSP